MSVARLVVLDNARGRSGWRPTALTKNEGLTRVSLMIASVFPPAWTS
jgi:hypothetical protein